LLGEFLSRATRAEAVEGGTVRNAFHRLHPAQTIPFTQLLLDSVTSSFSYFFIQLLHGLPSETLGPFSHARMDHRYLSPLPPGAYHLAMDPSPKSLERRGIRYSLNLPVSLTLAHQKFQARSESISLGGIRLTSASFIPEGAVIEVEVCIAHLPEPGTYLSARGKVLQVQSRAAGDFAVAVAFEHPIQFSMEQLKSGADFHGNDLPLKDLRLKNLPPKDLQLKDIQLKDRELKPQQHKDRQATNRRFEPSHTSSLRNEPVSTRGQRLGSAWFMET
jgi:hypothetical protein